MKFRLSEVSSGFHSSHEMIRFKCANARKRSVSTSCRCWKPEVDPSGGLGETRNEQIMIFHISHKHQDEDDDEEEGAFRKADMIYYFTHLWIATTKRSKRDEILRYSDCDANGKSAEMIRLDGAAFVCAQKAKIRAKVSPKRLPRTHGSITFKGSEFQLRFQLTLGLSFRLLNMSGKGLWITNRGKLLIQKSSSPDILL